MAAIRAYLNAKGERHRTVSINTHMGKRFGWEVESCFSSWDSSREKLVCVSLSVTSFQYALPPSWTMGTMLKIFLHFTDSGSEERGLLSFSFSNPSKGCCTGSGWGEVH